MPQSESDLKSIRKIGGQIRADILALGDVVGEKRAQILNSVTEFARKRPYAAVGLAFGAGFMLAGGLVSRTTGRTLAFAGKYVFGRVLREALAAALIGGIVESSNLAKETHH